MRLRDHNVQESHMLPLLRMTVHAHAITQDDTFNDAANVLRVSLGHQNVGILAGVVQMVAVTELVECVRQ
eukprot:11175992-Lingulodinium_polyedra.AAC.1